MIIDDTEHHDQNVLSQSSTCDIKIHDSPDFSQDTLNDVDMILSPREILQILVNIVLNHLEIILKIVLLVHRKIKTIYS